MNYYHNIPFIEFSYNYNMGFIEQSSKLPAQSHKNTRARFQIYSHLAIKIPEQC